LGKFDHLTIEEKRAKKAALQIVLAQGADTPEAFEAFFKIVYNKKLLPHAMKWVRQIYKAHEEGKGTVVEAFRGSAKTTVLCGFVAWRIGKEPHKSNLIVQVGDDIANNNSQNVAEIIEHNPGWKLIFPHVVPDKDRGWGAGGYEVKRTDIPYEQWVRINADRKDPTLLGLGYKSRAIIGKRPTGVFLIDDIHDENNTFSPRELAHTLKIVTGTIFPAEAPGCWPIFIGTPWVYGDTIDYVKKTGEYESIKTPLFTETLKMPDPFSVTVEQIRNIVGDKCVWQERFTPQEIKSRLRKSGSTEFSRMYQLDLEATTGQVLKREWLHFYPHENIHPSWPVVLGVDYASSVDENTNLDKADYSVFCIARKMPEGGLVICDGIRKKVSQAEAEETVKELAKDYPTLWKIAVESIGTGKELYNLLLRNSGLPIRPIPITHGRRGKMERFQRMLAPQLQNGSIWISDDPNNEFIKAFVDEWIHFPEPLFHDDTIDGVYMCAAAAKGALIPRREAEGEQLVYNKKKATNWYKLLGR